MIKTRLGGREIKRHNTLKQILAHKLKLKLRRQIPLGAIEADESQMNLGYTFRKPPDYYLD